MPNPVTTAIPNTGAGNRGNLIDLFQQRQCFVVFSVAEVQGDDFTNHRLLLLMTTGRIYRFDATSTAAHDGVNVLQDAAGNRFLKLNDTEGVQSGSQGNKAGLKYEAATNAYGMGGGSAGKVKWNNQDPHAATKILIPHNTWLDDSSSGPDMGGVLQRWKSGELIIFDMDNVDARMQAYMVTDIDTSNADFVVLDVVWLAGHDTHFTNSQEITLQFTPVGNCQMLSYTEAELADDNHAVNVNGKQRGMLVYNATSDNVCVAKGDAASDSWGVLTFASTIIPS